MIHTMHHPQQWEAAIETLKIIEPLAGVKAIKLPYWDDMLILGK